MTDDELRDAVTILHQRASRNWYQHEMWELIIDIESLLAGLPTEMDRAAIEREVEEVLKLKGAT